jgi:flavin-dependent dehydrogenase
MATPDSDGCVLALAVDRRVVDGHGPLEGLRRLNPQAAIWERLQSGVGREGAAKGAAAFPWLPDRLGNGNVLLIGDAAGYAEPFSGTGMAQAMFSAECATKAIVGAGDALRNYQRLMRRHRRALWKTLVLSALLRGRLARAALSRRFAPAEPWLARCVERVHVHGGL